MQQPLTRPLGGHHRFSLALDRVRSAQQDGVRGVHDVEHNVQNVGLGGLVRHCSIANECPAPTGHDPLQVIKLEFRHLCQDFSGLVPLGWAGLRSRGRSSCRGCCIRRRCSRRPRCSGSARPRRHAPTCCFGGARPCGRSSSLGRSSLAGQNEPAFLPAGNGAQPVVFVGHSLQVGRPASRSVASVRQQRLLTCGVRATHSQLEKLPTCARRNRRLKRHCWHEGPSGTPPGVVPHPFEGLLERVPRQEELERLPSDVQGAAKHVPLPRRPPHAVAESGDGNVGLAERLVAAGASAAATRLCSCCCSRRRVGGGGC
mmetsp:Transcript_1039/g.3981  ORF Transcript_1039/g.3981 Transcript_1039/m.3981 type:complete len:315 (-) Transcript_1039:488-1432(-)